LTKNRQSGGFLVEGLVFFVRFDRLVDRKEGEMMISFYRIEVGKKPGIFDTEGQKIKQTLIDARVKEIEGVRVIQVWLLFSAVPLLWRELNCLATQLFADPVIEQSRINRSLARQSKCQRIIGIAYNPDMTVSSESTAKEAIKSLGVSGIFAVRYGQKYVVRGVIDEKRLEMVRKALITPLIQHLVEDWSKEVPYQLDSETAEAVSLMGKVKKIRRGVWLVFKLT